MGCGLFLLGGHHRGDVLHNQQEFLARAEEEGGGKLETRGFI